MEKIAFGGGCHWCTEAVFQSIQGVHHVEQGFIASYGHANELSEGVIVHFDPAVTGLNTLIKIHLKTHSSSSNHSLRNKYRSAIYTYSETQGWEAEEILKTLAPSFPGDLIIKVLPLRVFEPSIERFQNYYIKDPDRPFCKRYIEPKFKIIRNEFPNHIKKKTKASD